MHPTDAPSRHPTDPPSPPIDQGPAECAERLNSPGLWPTGVLDTSNNKPSGPQKGPAECAEHAERRCECVSLHALAFPLARTGRLGLIPVLIGASAFGATIELIQPTFNRSAELSDWVADTLGVLIGIGLGLAYRRVRRHRP